MANFLSRERMHSAVDFLYGDSSHPLLLPLVSLFLFLFFLSNPSDRCGLFRRRMESRSVALLCVRGVPAGLLFESEQTGRGPQTQCLVSDLHQNHVQKVLAVLS